MPRRRQINAAPRWIGDLLRNAADAARWPFERLAWAVERRLIWPLRELTAGRVVQGRTLGAGALAVVAIAAVAFGILSISGGEAEPDRVASDAPVAAAATAAQSGEAEPAEPALQGVPPRFEVGEGVGVATAGDGSEPDGTTGEPVATPPTASAEGDEEGAATTSSQKPVPAGPAAMKVARRFSDAFVFYEIGQKPARALSVFDETATPELAAALAERPPRQPEGTEVPKARVLNLVPGPRSGGAYTVSASLMRVGTVSELRLKMMRQNGAWLVTDVRG